MTQWPESVDISDDGISQLISLLEVTYKKIVNELGTATSFGVYQRQQMLSQINVYLAELGVNVDQFLQQELPDYYKTGMSDAVKQLTNLGIKNIPTTFTQLHQDAVAALYSDSATSFADALQGVSRSSSRLLNQEIKKQITNDIAGNIARGETLRRAKTTIKGTLADNGLIALVDKRGRNWSLDTYAEMLYRTKMAEARNLGMVNQMAELGYDLVQVSAHGAIDVCGQWEGRILSTTGETKEYEGESVPTVDQATSDGLFHPNCRHALNAIVPDLAAEAYGYDKSSGQYIKGQINIENENALQNNP